MKDWLYDGEGEPDPTERELETLLRAPFDGAPPAARPRRWMALAAAAAVLLAAGAAWRETRGDAWEVGEWLEPAEPVQLAVADIGTLDVAAKSRLRLVASSEAEHRVELARGRIDARVWAPPRLFVVDTPAATAVDLGCAYTLEVDEAGDGWLTVTSGRVALETSSRAVTVLAGAEARMRKATGPGTPTWWDAPAELVAAVAALDAGGPLAPVLAAARPRDTLTLVHLLHRDERATVMARIAALTGLDVSGLGDTATWGALEATW